MIVSRPVQSAFLALATLVAGGEYAFMLCADQPQERFPGLTAACYIGFFWILWAYARVSAPIAPIVAVNRAAAWCVFLALAAGVAASYCLEAASAADAANFHRFMSLHALLAVGYLLLAVGLLFGDGFLWPLSGMLKFGRPFNR